MITHRWNDTALFATGGALEVVKGSFGKAASDSTMREASRESLANLAGIGHATSSAKAAELVLGEKERV